MGVAYVVVELAAAGAIVDEAEALGAALGAALLGMGAGAAELEAAAEETGAGAGVETGAGGVETGAGNNEVGMAVTGQMVV